MRQLKPNKYPLLTLIEELLHLDRVQYVSDLPKIVSDFFTVKFSEKFQAGLKSDRTWGLFAYNTKPGGLRGYDPFSLRGKTCQMNVTIRDNIVRIRKRRIVQYDVRRVCTAFRSCKSP